MTQLSKIGKVILAGAGCGDPNGCGRSSVSEIGFIGSSLGKYNLNLGGDHEGYRLNRLYKESLNEAELLAELDSLFADFKKERMNNESFGDYTHRTRFAIPV